MDFDEIIQLVNQVVIDRKGRPLKTVERIVLQGAWENSTYTHIAETAVGYTEDYLKKDVGPTLWKLLTDVIGNNTIKITKRNLQNVLQDWALQYAERVSVRPESGETAAGNPADAVVAVPASPLPVSPLMESPRLPCWDVPPVDISDFCGRGPEVENLQAWIVAEQCRLVMLWGLAGVGKTLLAAATVQRVQAEFEQCCYIPLPKETTATRLATTLLTALGESAASEMPWDRILQRLTANRCLVILDGGEQLFAAGQLAGTFRPDCAAVENFLQRVAEHQHRSCLLWIARENPQTLAQLAGARVRSHPVDGFSAQAASQFFSRRGHFTGHPEDWQRLVDRYGGSPQLLKGLAGTILQVYRGDIQRFLAEPPRFNADGAQVAQYLERLTDPEQELLGWLALAQVPMALSNLQQSMLSAPTMEVVQSLLARRMGFIGEGDGAPVLHVPLFIRRVMQAQLLSRLIAELEQEALDCFHRLPLLWTTASERVQAWQQRSLLDPLTAHLRQQYPDAAALTEKLRCLHQRVRSQFLHQPSYAAGNLIHLCQQLDVGLGGIDFSQLAVWEANLHRGGMQGANFSQAQFAHTLFAMALGRNPVVAFSDDGQLLAIGDHDGRLLLWNLATGKLSRVLVVESALPVRALAFSPDGEWLAVGSDNGDLALWSLSMAYPPESLKSDSCPVRALAFSPDGTWLAAGDEAGGVQLWDLASGAPLRHLSDHGGPIQHLQVSPRGDRLISCCEDQRACLWNPLSGELLAQYQAASNASLYTVGFTHLGAEELAFAAGYAERCLVIWDVPTSLPRWIVPTPLPMLLAVRLSADGRYLACSHGDGTVTVWDVPERQLRFTFSGFTAPVWTLVLGPDGRTLVTTGDYTVRIWDLDRGDCLRSLRSLRYPVSAVTFTHDGTQVLTGHEDGQVRLWQLNPAGTFARRLHSLKGHRQDVRAVAASADGRWLASSDGSSLRLWVQGSGDCRRSCNEPGVGALAFSPDSRWLVSGGEDGRLWAWSLTQEEPPLRFEGHQSVVSAVAISPDGSVIASSSRDRTLRLWDIHTGQALQTLDVHPGHIHALTLSPDGTGLLSASSDGWVQWWQGLPELVAAGNWQHPRAQIVYTVLYDAQDRLLAITGDTRTLEVWSVAENQHLATLSGHTQEIWQVCVSLDRRRLASASLGEEIRIWQLDSGHCEQILRPDRPYEGVNLEGAQGLSEPERLMLKSLGAVMA